VGLKEVEERVVGKGKRVKWVSHMVGLCYHW